jgi:hypothetical protein
MILVLCICWQARAPVAIVKREARWFAAAAMGENEVSSITRDGQPQGELSEGCCAMHVELIPDRCRDHFFSSGPKALVLLCIVKRPGHRFVQAASRLSNLIQD